jgi:hypothetical protein
MRGPRLRRLAPAVVRGRAGDGVTRRGKGCPQHDGRGRRVNTPEEYREQAARIRVDQRDLLIAAVEKGLIDRGAAEAMARPLGIVLP